MFVCFKFDPCWAEPAALAHKMFSLLYIALVPLVFIVVFFTVLPWDSAFGGVCTSVASEAHWSLVAVPSIFFGLLAASAAAELAWSSSTTTTASGGSSDSLYQTARLLTVELNLVYNSVALLLLFVARRFELTFREMRRMRTSEAGLKKQALSTSEAYSKLLVEQETALLETASSASAADDDASGGSRAQILDDLAEENAELRAEAERLERDIATMVKQSANSSTGLAEMLSKERAEKDELRAQLRDLDRQLHRRGGKKGN